MSLYINRITMRFNDQAVEAAYRRESLPMTLLLTRLAISMIIILFAGMATVGDVLADAQTLSTLLWIRLGIATPISVLLLSLCFVVQRYQMVILIGFLAGITVGGAQVAITYYSSPELAIVWHGVYGSIFFGTITMTGLNHISGTLTCLLILAVHSVVVLNTQGLGLAHYYIEMTNLVSVIFVAAISVYLIGFQSRKHFASEHKLSQVTESLKARENRLYTLYEYAPIAYATLSVDEQRLLDHNTAFKELLGLQGQQVNGTLWSEFLPVDDHSDEALIKTNPFASLLQGGVMVDNETLLQRPDGGSLQVLISAVPGHDEQMEVNEIRLTLVDISERKAAEQRFSVLMESAPDAILVCSDDGALVLANSRAEEVFGYDHNALLNISITRLLPDLKHQLGGAGKRVDQKLQARRHDGSLFSAELSLNQISNNQQNLLVMVIRDITQRQADEDRRAKNHRDMAAQTLINDAVKQALTEDQLLADVCRILAEVHDKRLVWIGYSQHDALSTIKPMARFGYEKGFLAQGIGSWSSAGGFQGPTGLAISSNEVQLVTDTKTDADFASWRALAISRDYASVLALPLSLKGKPFGAITLYSQHSNGFDQASIKNLQRMADTVAHAVQHLRTKLARSAAENELKASEERGRLLLQSIDEGIFGLDIAGRLTFMNPAGGQMLGWQDYELVGRKVHGLIHHMNVNVNGEQLAVEQSRMYQTFSEGRPQYVDNEVLWRQDGSSFAAAYASRPITKDGQLVGAVVSFRDISELKKVSADLLVERDRTHEQAQARFDFLANMSDEIGGPMETITRLCGLSADEGFFDQPSREKQRDNLRQISRSADELQGIVHDILDFARIETGQPDAQVMQIRQQLMSLRQLLAEDDSEALEVVELLSEQLRGAEAAAQFDPVKEKVLAYELDAALVLFDALDLDELLV
ncbi:MAG: PAS domain S-box-containing protein [Phenylobacterium sp.]|jgi:PAS domain S-box-containing protein